MKLSEAEEGKYRIRRVKNEKLMELGFVPGRGIEVVRRGRGRLVIVIKGEKFAVAEEIAEGIEVD